MRNWMLGSSCFLAGCATYLGAFLGKWLVMVAGVSAFALVVLCWGILEKPRKKTFTEGAKGQHRVSCDKEGRKRVSLWWNSKNYPK